MVTMQQAIQTIRHLRDALEQWPDAAANGQRVQPDEAVVALDMADEFLVGAGETT